MTAARSAIVGLALTLSPLVACTSASQVASPTASQSSSEGSGGALFASGSNDDGQLGTGAAVDVRSLTPVYGLDGRQLFDIVAVAAGDGQSLAVTADGHVLAWGANNHGQLGDGTMTDSTSPVEVIAPDGNSGPLTGAVAVAADSDLSMALLSDGTVVTWGENDAGQRGIGTTEAQAAPTRVRGVAGEGDLSNVCEISADGRTELARLCDGRAVAWGANSHGELGDGTQSTRTLPGYVLDVEGSAPLAGVISVAMGGQHALASLDDGRVVAWGNNDHGQLGRRANDGRTLPGFVPGIGGDRESRSVQVAAAELHGYAVLASGNVLGWGNNSAGQLGNGVRQPYQNAPGLVLDAGSGASPLEGVTRVWAGEAYGVALLQGGQVVTWGAGSRGQLAAGEETFRLRPGPVSFPAGEWRGLAVGTGERHLLVVAE